MQKCALIRQRSHHTVDDVQTADHSASVTDTVALHRLYVTEQLAMADIARRLGCSASTIRRRLHARAIPVRARGPNFPHRLKARTWSADVAWLVGLMASDGNLGRTGHGMTLTSNDVEILELAR